MTDANRHKRELRLRRHFRVRKKVSGTAQRPRLAVFRSNRHISAQIIDDLAGKTLVSASTQEKDLKGPTSATVEGAMSLGQVLAERAKERGISSVVFDRSGFRYHGRVAAVADGARQGGLSL